jgi:integrase
VLAHNVTAGDRLASRWFMALTHGVRQGEALGLRWDHVDLETGALDLAWQLQRAPFKHGCGDQAGGTWPCGLRRPGSCPQRRLDVQRDFEHEQLDGGLILQRPKSRAGTRLIALLPWAVSALRARHDLYRAERPGYTRDHGLVWPRPDGRPIDPRVDSTAWHAMLAAAGVRDVELHAARHTAATMLHEAGVPEHTAMAILGHSSVSTTRAYQHVSLDEQRKALGRLGELLAIED